MSTLEQQLTERDQLLRFRDPERYASWRARHASLEQELLDDMAALIEYLREPDLHPKARGDGWRALVALLKQDRQLDVTLERELFGEELRDARGLAMGESKLLEWMLNGMIQSGRCE